METDPLTAQVLHGTYDVRLVVISYLVACLASYTALDLARRVTGTHGTARRIWLAGGAFAMGLGIWAMHFIGMLAFSLPVALQYDAPLVLLSLLVAILAAALALVLVSRPRLRWPLLLGGGVIMGSGIVAMHYIGMAALRMPATIRYDPFRWWLSVAIAVGASIVALWLSLQFRRDDRTRGRWIWLKVGSAACMGGAIVGMHYTGMAAAHFTTTAPLIVPTGLDYFTLGMSVGLGTLLILSITLISSVLNQHITAQAGELASLFHANPDLVYVLDQAGTILNANPGAAMITGYAREQVLATPVTQWVAPASIDTARHHIAAMTAGAAQHFDLQLRAADGHLRDLAVTSIPILRGTLVTGAYWLARDETRYRQEAARRHDLQAEIIRRQDALVLELSTPLIPIGEDIVLLPLIGAMNAARSDHILATLLAGVSERRARTAIIDISGLRSVDHAVATLILQAAQTTRLLGTTCILVGIRADVAQMLVAMNIDLQGIVTQSTVQAAIQTAVHAYDQHLTP